MPIAKHKMEGPATCLTFLGIETDTVAFELRLPEEKFARLRAQFEAWGDRKSCQRKELESFVGLLNHSFLRRMIERQRTVPQRE